MVNFQKIEKKWQDKWEKAKIFQVKEDSKKKKFYVLEMYPYPSSSGLHMGHALNYTIGDVYARFKRMNNYNVLYPMGYDSLGLPAENAAIKNKSHPRIFTEDAIKNFIRQQKELGLSYDWSRMVETHKPDYYKWDQWIFLKMYERGLAYKKKASVNWCGKCNTVLANEQVHDGKCWRHKDVDVEIKQLEQWFFKTTEYADELYEGIEKLKNWNDDVKAMQRNWIGKSYGTIINFKIENKNKVILVDAINAFVIKERGIFKEMHQLLEEFSNKKIILTNANDEEKKKFNLNSMPYEVFTLKHSPDKTNPDYYKQMLKHFCLKAEDVIYFEHNEEAVKSARSTGIETFHYDKDKKDLKSLRKFICTNLHENWPVFTTRPDTIYGVTFMVISAQHQRLNELVKGTKYEKDVNNFLKKIKSTKQEDLDKLEKEGVFIGKYAVNPINNEKIPVYAGNFVLADYGCGMVMAVPAHDQRDFEFAKKYKIPIKIVINPNDYSLSPDKMSRAYTSDGVLVNSGEFNGTNSTDAIEEITKYLEKKNLGKKTVQYKLKDWLISRQRFWGTPIPIIYCAKCGMVPVPEKDLPVKLPDDVKFTSNENPLLNHSSFVNVKCPKCNGKAKRETDTMDTFVNSSWYFLRYCDPKNDKKIFDSKKVSYWMPIDQYIGGREHACMHLIYFRFYTKFLRDIGLIKFDEPTYNLFNQGMLHGEDGTVMSKSAGNGVLPEEVSVKYGIDTARLFLVSMASQDKDVIWSEKGIQGTYKFTNKIVDYFDNVEISKKKNEKLESNLNKTIKEIEEHIEGFKYNLAVIKLRQLFENISKENEANKEMLEDFLKILSPFAPHITEELWEKLGNKEFISTAKWPKYDEKKIKIEFEFEDEFIERIKHDINTVIKLVGKEPSLIKIFVSEPWKYGVYKKLIKTESRDMKTIINDIMVKGHEKEIPRIAQSFIKNPNNFDKVVLDQEKETKILNDNKKELEEYFKAGIEIIKADKSEEGKAKQAYPGKVAILIE
ncbi:MAG: leucine--tRNA ligase [Candidatus Nanoarchaeia archaeon]|nr:leucine--tRNA ligase [Candidatus Nanoarchaeia archaeon]